LVDLRTGDPSETMLALRNAMRRTLSRRHGLLGVPSKFL
jgi:hypothetical protein